MPFLDRSHFLFFRNREMDSLYIALALLHFAEGLISIFVPIYFWGLGFPLWEILLFYFLYSLFFVLFILISLPFLQKLSDKMMMFLSIPFLVVYFIGLSYIPDYRFLFFVLPAITAVSRILFNTGYQVDFSESADDKYVGREVGMRHMTVSLTKLISPFLGGFLITRFGFGNNFIIGASILFLAILPLFFFPARKLSRNLRWDAVLGFLKNKKLMPFTIAGIGYALEISISRVVWTLFIFFSIGSIQNFGGIISIGLLTSAFVTYLVGFLSDHGKRRRIISLSSVLYFLVWIMRPFLPAL